MTDTYASLREVLRRSADKLERLAFSIRAPNVYTPRLMELVIAMRAALLRTQAPQESDEPLPAPGIHAAVHYAGWLRREAHRHQEPKASVLRQTARMLDVLQAECARLHQELIDAQAPAADGDAQPTGATLRCRRCGDTADVAFNYSGTDRPPMIELMGQVLVEMRHARKFIASREKMHPVGIAQFDQACAAIDAAMATSSSKVLEGGDA